MNTTADAGNPPLARLTELKTLGALPSPKGAALAVMRLTRQADVSVGELVHVVQADPALVGRLIKAANASARGTQRPVAAVSDAVVMLGISNVRYLATSFSLVTDYQSGQCRNFDYRRFWSHSLACAVAAQAIAARVRSAPPEEVFSVGLLSRIGELALASVFPDQYGQILAQSHGASAQDLCALERAAFAIDHDALTAALLEDWGLPNMFVAPVLAQSRPAEAAFPPDSREYRLTWTLVLARQIADICLAAEAERRGLLPGLLLLGGKLSLDGDALLALCDGVVGDWQAWAQQFQVAAHVVPPFEELSLPPAAPQLSLDGLPQAAASAEALRVLVVEDEKSMRLFLKLILTQAGYTVFEAENGQAGFEKALEVMPHILITDWMMPEMDGVELTRALRQSKFGRAIYILILTALGAEDSLVAAFDAGVDDFITKPVSPRVLGARLRAGQRIVMLQRELEHDREEIRRFASELAVSNQRLHEAALTDVLTGFPNRRHAIERFRQEWQAANRSLRPLACLMVDVDDFKRINDTFGHDAGDRVLKQTAQAIKSGVRAQDVVCRTGGDEFLVICPETDLAAALICGERVRREVAAMRLTIGTTAIGGSVSIGVAERDAEMPDIDALIKRADEGVYLSKQSGRNRVMTVQDRPRNA